MKPMTKTVRPRLLLASILVFGSIAMSGFTAARAGEQRVALVIGNAAYQSLPSLGNPVKDATDIASALIAAGFDTTIRTDVRRRDLYKLIDAFAAKIAASPETVGLFYYAGHGVQTNGKNYLIPVDAAVQNEGELEAEAVDAGKVLRAMADARNAVNIVILDACRDNPLPAGRSLSRGLVQMEAPRGTFIGYAAGPGQAALDGEPGQNGIFTGVLLQELKSSKPIEEVFKRTIAGVEQRTFGRQVPWMESSLQGDFYFLGPATVNVTPPAPAAAPLDGELLFWQSIMANGTIADFEEYLRQYPQGRFVVPARSRVAALRAPPVLATAPPAPASSCEELQNRVLDTLSNGGISRNEIQNDAATILRMSKTIEANCDLKGKVFSGPIARIQSCLNQATYIELGGSNGGSFVFTDNTKNYQNSVPKE